MNLQKLNVQEMNTAEMKSTDGGGLWGSFVNFLRRMDAAAYWNAGPYTN
jgi:hypothetical protein